MNLILKILIFVLAIFQTNISESKVFVFAEVVTQIRFIENAIENKNEVTTNSGNGFVNTCKSESDLLDYRKQGLRTNATAAKGVTKLLNPVINMSEKGLAHTLDRHTVNGIAKWANKSKFLNASEVKSLIQQATQMPMIKQAHGNFSRTVNAGINIGIDRATGNPTSIYTVITNRQGSLITAFPGRP
jgi:hypothetical protein